jgi:alpha-tubulin suppressor-like RCC1 family protein
MVDMNTPTALALTLAALVAGSSLLALGCATDVLDVRTDGDSASGATSTSGSSGTGGSTSATGTGGMDCSQKVPCTPTFLGPIAAGGEHACAVTTTGALKCWGSSSEGQLGNGTQSYSSGAVPVEGLSAGVAIITAGELHTCANTIKGEVACWGSNFWGQLGVGSITKKILVPEGVSGLSGVRAVAAGGFHTCAVTGAGGVECWGWNDGGQLGSAAGEKSLVPLPVKGLSSGVVALTAGLDHSCALTVAGGVKCWGANSLGELGNGTTTASVVPVDVTTLTSGVLAIAAGSQHTCALTTESTVMCWGWNGWGQLGSSGGPQSLVPFAVAGLPSGVVAITAGAAHTCALTAAGEVLCWGWNAWGQFGNGTTTGSPAPTAVLGLSGKAISIAAGGAFTCAVLASGGVDCWGYNATGQLGDGTLDNSQAPVHVVGF